MTKVRKTPKSPDAEFKELKRHSEDLEKKNEALAESLQRVVADFDNYRKRMEQEKTKAASATQSELLMKVFPILDNFRRASEHAPAINVADLENPSITEDEWRRIHAYFEGMRHIERQLEQILSESGLKRIETRDKQFDPNTMEAISYEEHPELPEDTIIDELEGGYMYGDKVIRPAKVRVSKGTP